MKSTIRATGALLLYPLLLCAGGTAFAQTTPEAAGEVTAQAVVATPVAEAPAEVAVQPAAEPEAPVAATPESASKAAVQAAIEEAKPLRLLKRGLDFSGYFWVDVGSMERTNAQPGQYDQLANYMQGRLVLGGTYHREFGNDFFGTAKGELILFENSFSKSQYEPHTLDAYLNVGQKRWDIQVGRFLGWEVYHRGQGIELFTAEEAGALLAPSMYWLETVRGYKNEAGQAAVHLYPFDFMGIELAGVYGQEANQNNLGFRPVVELEYWKLQLVGGYEYLAQTPQTEADKVRTTRTGYAGKLQFTHQLRGPRGPLAQNRLVKQGNPLDLPPANSLRFGVSYAKTDVETIDINGDIDGAKTYDRESVGGFFDVDLFDLALGLGYHRTTSTATRGDTNVHHQAFASLLYRLPLDGLYAKAVYGYALGEIEDIDTNQSWENAMQSFRVRLMYQFH